MKKVWKDNKILIIINTIINILVLSILFWIVKILGGFS